MRRSRCSRLMRRVEVPNFALPRPCPGRKSRSCAILGRFFPGPRRVWWGGRPILGCSTSPGQLIEAAATGDVGAGRRLRRRAAVQNSPPGRRNQIQNTTNSPPTRGIFRDIREAVGRPVGLRSETAQRQ